jgi:predicted Rossmann-fold nucleotide-binding protein
MQNDSHECTLEQWLHSMPDVELLPFNVDHTRLYSVSDLYKGYDIRKPASWKQSFDNVVYQWYGLSRKTPHSKKLAALAMRLHDTAIETGIANFLLGKKAVGFMGGHGVLRTADEFRKVALLARELCRLNFTVISGGGPGLMEAANFGAFMAPYDDDQFATSLDLLGTEPSYKNVDGWISTAARVRENLLERWNGREEDKSQNLGVPTWVYGFEPPNLFSTHIAKYFFNSLREDGLVTIANAGLIFGAGDAGTVQEIFQDATRNFYPAAGAVATPMILYGREFWNPPTPMHGKAGLTPNPKPVYPLLERLALDAKPPFDKAVCLTDSSEEIVQIIVRSNSPKESASPRAADLKLSEFRRRHTSR